jgi:hypothetical protein
MNRRSQDSADELVQALRAKLDKEEGSPDDVFADDSSSARSKQKDDELAAFDAYMAALLGEVVSEQESEPEENEKKHTKSKKKRSSAKKEEKIEQPTVVEGDAIVFSDVDAPEEELLPDDETVLKTDADAEASDATVIEEELPHPDTQVELPDDVIGEERPQIDEVHVTEETEVQPPMEVIEQLRIPADSFAAVPDGVSQAVSEDMTVTAQEEQGTIGAPLVDEEYLPVEGFAPEGLYDEPAQEETAAEAEQEDAALHEGDIVIDADDELPLETEKDTKVSDEEEQEKKTADKVSEKTVTPVASPLDAARSANERAAQTDAPRPKQSPLDAIAAERGGAKGNVESLGNGPAFGRDRRERTLSDADVELLLDLGYENNLTAKVGSQRIETLKNRTTDGRKQKKQLRSVYGCSGEEYTGHAQDQDITDAYRKHTARATARLIFTVLLTLLIALSDFLPLFRDRLPEVFSSLPTSGMYGAIGLSLLCLTALLSLPLLKRGIVDLFRFSPSPATLPAMLVFFTVLYDVPGLLDPVCGMMLNLPTALMLTMLAIGERIKIKSEKKTFSIVSARSRKIALSDMEAKKKKVIRDGHIVKIINDDADLDLRRVRRTEQIGGYFHRTGEPSLRHRALSPVLMIALLISVAIGVTTLLLKHDLKVASTVCLLTLQLTLPASALIAYVYPKLLAAESLGKQGCAIIGDSAVDQYATDSILLFDDTEMFRSKSSTEITIKGGGDTRKYIRYAKRLFRTLGGTLRNVTTSDLSEETYEDRVEILRVMDEGIEARIDGKVHILAGTSAFMVKNGIRVPSETAELLVRRHVESCILYLAFDGKLRLGYEIDYRISGRFEHMVAELANHRTAVAIESYDPCIHAEFLVRSREPGMTPVRVIKPVHFEKTVDSSVVDSGVVATRSARDIAKAVTACHRLADNDRRVKSVYYVGLLIGALLSAGLMFFDMVDSKAVLLTALLQCVWCIPCVLLSRKNMTNEQDKKSENDISN